MERINKLIQVIKNITLFIWYSLNKIKDKISLSGIIKLLILTGLLIWYVKSAYSLATGLVNYLSFAPCIIKLRYHEKDYNYDDEFVVKKDPIVYNGKMTYFKKIVLISIDYIIILINNCFYYIFIINFIIIINYKFINLYNYYIIILK